MNVLLLTPTPHYMVDAIEAAGDRYKVSMGAPSVWPEDIDFIVSLGYRQIIKEPHLSIYEGRMINIHASFLPWNRGADPNFWSWFDNTPKGVSIHYIDEGIDTGDILYQLGIDDWGAQEPTLRSSYSSLMNAAIFLFAQSWPRIRKGMTYKTETNTGGSYHKIGDRDPWMAKLPHGWDTPVKFVEELGASGRSN